MHTMDTYPSSTSACTVMQMNGMEQLLWSSFVYVLVTWGLHTTNNDSVAIGHVAMAYAHQLELPAPHATESKQWCGLMI